MLKRDFNEVACFANLLKSHFGICVLLKICCLFSEHFLQELLWSAACGKIYLNSLETIMGESLLVQKITVLNI